MSATAPHSSGATSLAGLRLTAEEFFELSDDGNRYELIDGVVLMSPSPTPRHQLIAKIILRQLDDFVEKNELGLVLYETDVALGTGACGKEIVYRPDILFIESDRVAQIRERIDFAPSLVVEVISPDSRSLDTSTKREDYERAGVREYWLIDPQQQQATFYRLDKGRFVEAPAAADRFASAAVTGFEFDLKSVREAFGKLTK